MLKEIKSKKKLIVSSLKAQYGIQTETILFLPLGADIHSVIYRVEDKTGKEYLVKIRTSDFNNLSVLVPNYLFDSGIKYIIPSVKTIHGEEYYFDGKEFLIVYEYIKSSSEHKLITSAHKTELGRLIKEIHNIQLPEFLMNKLDTYEFDGKWKKELVKHIEMISKDSFTDLVANELIKFLRQKISILENLVSYFQSLIDEIILMEDNYVLCHGDLHFWNLLIDWKDSFYLVDWDTVILAPREKDLMFIGGGIDNLWNTQQDIKLFYKGYGDQGIDARLLNYFRAERIMEDIVVIIKSVCYSDLKKEDRERELGFLRSNFEPNNTIDNLFKICKF